ncbi:hypothetical protein ACFYKX_16065 [Cytobacillus sp. FJAT-54145]|uniref:Uncharacterized protein n=1 Tax=Cytobacillus spartinae TaxID=3299023 RepID=A0ABW6KEG8_9BACI
MKKQEISVLYNEKTAIFGIFQNNSFGLYSSCEFGKTNKEIEVLNN